jgi:dUTP pyrophosphatase
MELLNKMFNSYCGDGDQWHFGAIFLKDGNINQGDRIAQFRINLAQNATWYAKFKWLLTSKIIFLEVEALKNSNRGGMGSTGKK